MKSKKLVCKHLRPLLDGGQSQKSIASAMAYGMPNNISMLLSEKHPKYLISPNKIPTLSKLCKLSPRAAEELFFARLDDAAGRTVEMSKESLEFFRLQVKLNTIEECNSEKAEVAAC